MKGYAQRGILMVDELLQEENEVCSLSPMQEWFFNFIDFK